jgi:uncharacterized membrane protein YdjX (TVP38/TMEM64 family)
MISRLTKNKGPEMYLSFLFVTCLTMALTILGSIVLLLHVQPCRIPPVFGLWELSIMGLVGIFGTSVNLVRLARALGASDRVGSRPRGTAGNHLGA